jgi:hypothetical protein
MQYYFGWGSVPGLAAVPQGAARYLRFRMYLEPGTNLIGNQGPWSAKGFIVADGQNIGTNRIVGHFGVGGINDTDFFVGASRNIDGGIYAVPGQRLVPGRWTNVQFEFQSSTNAGTANGRIRIWIDGANTSLSTPTASSGSFVFTTEGWNTIAVGRISQTTLRAGGSLAYRIATDWEWDDGFDPGWHQGGTQSTPPPAAPTNPRVIRVSLNLLAPLALVSIWQWRRRPQQGD